MKPPFTFVLIALVACRDRSSSTDGSPDGGPSYAEALAASSVQGSIHSTGGALGTWETTLRDCRSGEVEGFFGADFYAPGSAELRLRYVHDAAKGEVVKIVYPAKKDTALVLDRDATCAVLEGRVEKTNFKTWTPKGEIRHVSGHVKFDCLHTGGAGHVTGEAAFSQCH